MVGGFASGRGIVVAGGAAPQYLVVIHSQYRCPGHGAMTGLAGNAAVDVTGRLATRGLAVVTAGAIALDGCMIEHRIIPAEGAMTVAAVVP